MYKMLRLAKNMLRFHDLRHISSKFSPPVGPGALERTPGPPADIARAPCALAGDASRRERGPLRNKSQAPLALNPALPLAQVCQEASKIPFYPMIVQNTRFTFPALF